MATRGRIVIDAERCKGCELCASVCPHQAIHLSKAFNANGFRPAEWNDINSECTGCAACAVICPDAAIMVYREVILRQALAVL
jgi:2-oxoglutarate ferredoxin oxidoreductase subunit delta